MRPFSSSTKEPQKLISSFFLLTHQVCSRRIIPEFRSCSYLFCYTCFGLSALHKLMFQIIANGSYNLRAYSTATVILHSLPTAKVLHIKSAMRPFSSSTKEPQKLISSFFLLTHQVCSRRIIPEFRSCSYLFCYTCFGLSALHKLMFQIIANGSYNLRAYSTATVFIHSLPIAKVLHITSLRIFLLTISQ